MRIRVDRKNDALYFRLDENYPLSSSIQHKKICNCIHELIT
jgi:hypothetical protein